jgi:hypothetical protein
MGSVRHRNALRRPSHLVEGARHGDHRVGLCEAGREEHEGERGRGRGDEGLDMGLHLIQGPLEMKRLFSLLLS